MGVARRHIYPHNQCAKYFDTQHTRDALNMYIVYQVPQQMATLNLNKTHYLDGGIFAILNFVNTKGVVL